jgi:hypothetical protein
MTPFHNPALRQEPKSKPLTVLTYVSRETLLEWLERTGKLKSDDVNESPEQKLTEGGETPEDLEENLEPLS